MEDLRKARTYIAKMLDLPPEFIERWKPPDIPDADDQEFDPQKAKMRLAQMGQLIQQLTQEIQVLNQERDGKVLELRSKERIAAHGDETAMMVALIKKETSENIMALHEEMAAMKHWVEMTVLPPQPPPPPGQETAPESQPQAA